MKKLIAGLLVVLMVFSLAACGPSESKIEDWDIHQLGHIAVRIPSDEIEEETEKAYGVHTVLHESAVPGLTVRVIQFAGFIPFLLELDLPMEFILSESLRGAVQGGIGDFLTEAGGGEIQGELSGETNGVRFYGLYGETVLDTANFKVHAFAYGDDFYAVMILWSDDKAEFVEPFFESVRFS